MKNWTTFDKKMKITQRFRDTIVNKLAETKQKKQYQKKSKICN